MLDEYKDRERELERERHQVYYCTYLLLLLSSFIHNYYNWSSDTHTVVYINPFYSIGYIEHLHVFLLMISTFIYKIDIGGYISRKIKVFIFVQYYLFQRLKVV